MAKCPNCGKEVKKAKKTWKMMTGKSGKNGKRTQLTIGIYDCCGKTFRQVLGKRKIGGSPSFKLSKIGKKGLVGLAALALVVVALIGLTSGYLAAQQSLSANGNIGSDIPASVNVGVYTSAAATDVCSSISWGTIMPGTTVSQIVYVKNTGNTAEALNLTISGWDPSYANSYLTVNWDQEGSVLSAGSVVPANISLTVASDTDNLTSFNFNIIITGTQETQ